MPGSADNAPLSVENLNSTSYNADGDGPKTEPLEVRRTWYGKKKKELKDGTGTLKPVRQVKVSVRDKLNTDIAKERASHLPIWQIRLSRPTNDSISIKNLKAFLE